MLATALDRHLARSMLTGPSLDRLLFVHRQPWFYGWGFNLPRGQALLEKWNLIPEGIDVLITHGPPLGESAAMVPGRPAHAGPGQGVWVLGAGWACALRSAWPAEKGPGWALFWVQLAGAFGASCPIVPLIS